MPGHGPACAVLEGEAAGEKPAAAFPIVPEQTWPGDRSPVTCKIGPTIVVTNPLNLPVAHSKKRPAGLRRQLPGEIARDVGASKRGLVHDEIADRLVTGPSCDEFTTPPIAPAP